MARACAHAELHVERSSRASCETACVVPARHSSPAEAARLVQAPGCRCHDWGQLVIVHLVQGDDVAPAHSWQGNVAEQESWSGLIKWAEAPRVRRERPSIDFCVARLQAKRAALGPTQAARSGAESTLTNAPIGRKRELPTGLVGMAPRGRPLCEAASLSLSRGNVPQPRPVSQGRAAPMAHPSSRVGPPWLTPVPL